MFNYKSEIDNYIIGSDFELHFYVGGHIKIGWEIEPVVRHVFPSKIDYSNNIY